MKHQERHDQILLVNYARMKYPGIITIVCPVVFYGGNATQRIIQGRNMKKMGFMKHTPDVFFCRPVGEFHGLFIELKKEKGGKIDDGQRAMIGNLIVLGYCAVICEGYDEAVKMLDGYMNGQLKTIKEP